MRRLLPVLGMILALSVSTGVDALDVPPLQGRVNDVAGLLPPEVESRIESKLADFEARHGTQVVVLTVPSLEGDAIEDFSIRVVEGWQLGRADDDDGILLLVARDDRKMRIEVGYGLEGDLTDAESGRILDGILRPHFREGDYPGGIERGVDAILGKLQGLDVIPAARSETDFDSAPVATRLGTFAFMAFIVGTFAVAAVSAPGCAGWVLYFFLMPFFAAAGAVLHPVAALVAWLIWAIGFPILRALAQKRGWGRGTSGRSGRSVFFPGGFGGGGFSGGGGFGGFSGGGFSGGGGSFGGGGASSSW